MRRNVDIAYTFPKLFAKTSLKVVWSFLLKKLQKSLDQLPYEEDNVTQLSSPVFGRPINFYKVDNIFSWLFVNEGGRVGQWVANDWLTKNKNAIDRWIFELKFHAFKVVHVDNSAAGKKFEIFGSISKPNSLPNTSWKSNIVFHLKTVLRRQCWKSFEIVTQRRSIKQRKTFLRQFLVSKCFCHYRSSMENQASVSHWSHT